VSIRNSLQKGVLCSHPVAGISCRGPPETAFLVVSEAVLLLGAVLVLLQATFVDTAQIINAMGIMPFTGGIWDVGLSFRVGMEIMLEEVNANPNILPGYHFNILWMNGGCTGIDASSFVLDALFERTFKIFAPNRTLAELDVDHDGYVTTQDTASMTQTWGMDRVGSFPVAVLPTCSREVMRIFELVNKGHMVLMSPGGATNPVLSDRS
jgi:hypothetical protein